MTQPRQAEEITLEVSDISEAVRLDTWIAEQLSSLSRSSVKQLIDEGQITVNGRKTKGSRILRGGETILVRMPEIKEVEVEPENIPLDILYEDNDIIVINKAAGMVVHPAPGHSSGTLVNALLHHCNDLSGINGVLRPGIVHRLDAGTTGLIVSAKNDKAHLGLSNQFQERSVTKYYKTIVFGPVRKDEGTIETEIDRDPGNRLRMAVVEQGGRIAKSKWKVEQSWSNFSLLRVQILTGRTHQVRVHCAHIGHPVVGDDLYAGKRWRGVENTQYRALAKSFSRPALHAWYLKLNHPVTNGEMEFKAQMPTDMLEFMRKTGAQL